ncbi:MAG: glycoside hydrolase family 97 catalytic domain-containing protein [Phycisphaerales bacterium]|nr:glycoside hydrolase family 97 catalytic domain-containing protein [Phycisphaerales bacterium]
MHSVARLVLLVSVWAVGQAIAQTGGLPPRADLRLDDERAQSASERQGQRAAPRTLRSPDGRLRVELRLPAAASDSSPEWSAWFGDEALFAASHLRLVLEGGADLLRGAKVEGLDEGAHDELVPILFGKAGHAHDHHRQLRVGLRSTAGLRVDIVIRCFDDALAFRYEVPEQDGLRELRLADEGTTFRVAGEPTAYVQLLPHHKTSHEHPITVVAASAIEPDKLLDLPLTLAWPSGIVASITEASLRRYAGMSLMRDASGALVSALAPRQDGLEVVCALPMQSPWRVVLVGARPGTLLESNTIHCLNDPPEVTDTAWIKPGKITWPWWNGYLFEAAPTAPILSQAMSVQYIDFCAAHGIAFHAVVADEKHTPWYHQPKVGLFPGPGTDATRARADLDMEALRKYATEKGVGLWTWVHHGAVRGRVEAVFAAFERLGWNGVMVDFLDSDDQETVEFAEAVLAAAARHHVLVHFHGMFKPTGLRRTFPNLMNHEGALNLEYLKWADTCTPEHTLLVAFTRLIAGPVDYHLGGFRAVRRTDFKPTFTAPHVLGTRGHQLGLYVCFDNPAPMVADYPAAYRDQPGFDFLTTVPTWWDETRVLAGEIGRVLVTARRRGRAWFVGGIAAGPARELALPLTFLGEGRWSMRVWGDVPDADPNQLAITTATVGPGDTLRVRVALDGGFAARFEPGDR